MSHGMEDSDSAGCDAPSHTAHLLRDRADAGLESPPGSGWAHASVANFAADSPLRSNSASRAMRLSGGVRTRPRL
jgi:hypothetical protein